MKSQLQFCCLHLHHDHQSRVQEKDETTLQWNVINLDTSHGVTLCLISVELSAAVVSQIGRQGGLESFLVRWAC